MTLDRYFDHPADPSLGMRAILEKRTTSGEVVYVTYEWNPDLPLEVQQQLVGKAVERLHHKEPTA